MKKSLRFGLLINIINNQYHMKIVRGVVDACKQLGIRLYIYPGEALNSTYPDKREQNVVYKLVNTDNLDGLLILSPSVAADIDMETLNLFCAGYSSIPVMSFSFDIDSGYSIEIDNRGGMESLLKHLLDIHGYQRIGFMGGPENNKEATLRFNVFKEYLQSEGRQFEESFYFPGDFTRKLVRFSIDRIAEAIDNGMEALVCANEEMAIAVLDELEERGIKVPHDLAVVGFDNFYDIEYAFPRLTTVSQPISILTYQAVLNLYNVINGKSIDRRTIFPTRLIVGESCGCKRDHSRDSSILQGELEKQTVLTTLESSEAILNFKEWIINQILETSSELTFDRVKIRELIFGMVNKLFDELFFDKGRGDFIYFIKSHGHYSEYLDLAKLATIRHILNIFLNIMMSAITDRDKLVTAERLFRRANRLISESWQEAEIQKNLKLRQLTDAISTKHKLKALTEILVEIIPLNIKTDCFYLSLYAGVKSSFSEDDIPTICSRLVLAYNKKPLKIGAEEAVYTTAELIPESFLPPEDNNAFLVLPLVYQERNFGFLVLKFVPGIESFYEALRSRISLNLATIDMLEQIEESNRELDYLNKNLEKKVEERTIDLARANERLKELDIAKSNFFANVSHELRTPLTLILSPLESLLSGDYGDSISKNDGRIKAMFSNSNRLLKLINNLLDFSKVDAGRMSLNKQKTDISKLLSFYTSSIYSGIESRGLSIKLEDKTEGVVAWIDRDLIEKAIFNLISNAMKFTPLNGMVTINLSREAGTFSITVSDTGIGIPASKLGSIFERFIQLDSSSSRKYEGTGIGLAFTREIVRLHEGEITVKSREGVGSDFTITLPYGKAEHGCDDEIYDDFCEIKPYHLIDIDDQRAQESLNVKPIEAKVKKEKILVVDDNRDMRNFIVSLLESNYYVSSAKNGKEGLIRAKELEPDLIVSDVMMPEMNGYEFIHALKSDSDLKAVPVILLTARADISSKVEGLEKGADDFLSKPFNARELMARIASNLEMKRMRDELVIQRDALFDKKELLEELVERQVGEIKAAKEMAEQQLEDFILVLGTTIESKDHYTGGHVDRVAWYSVQIAKKLGLHTDIIREIYLGAIVHDLGKIGIKDSIINKEGKLTPEERAVMETHPVLGKNMLAEIRNLRIAERIAYCHQERWDGRGYPQGLKGHDIPLEARIVTVADYWDAIITDRPYRKAMSLKNALRLMQKERGKAFDPELLDHFLDAKDKIYLRFVTKEQLRELAE